jgi:hypothetical protein
MPAAAAVRTLSRYCVGILASMPAETLGTALRCDTSGYSRVRHGMQCRIGGVARRNAVPAVFVRFRLHDGKVFSSVGACDDA